MKQALKRGRRSTLRKSGAAFFSSVEIESETGDRLKHKFCTFLRGDPGKGVVIHLGVGKAVRDTADYRKRKLVQRTGMPDRCAFHLDRIAAGAGRDFRFYCGVKDERVARCDPSGDAGKPLLFTESPDQAVQLGVRMEPGKSWKLIAQMFFLQIDRKSVV